MTLRAFRDAGDGYYQVEIEDGAPVPAWLAGMAEVDVAPAAAPKAPAPEEISDRQFFVELAVRKLITEQEAEDAVSVGAIPAPLVALINQLPEEQRFPARMFLKGATKFYRNHAMTIGIGALYGFDAAAMDDFFERASRL